MKRITKWVRNQRGAAIILVAGSMIAVVSAVAIAIDVGMLLVARSEAQRAADSGALAGAGWLIIDPDDETGARARAESFAEQNLVRGFTPDVIPDEDIDVILDSAKVRVRVRMIDARSLAMPTYFARVFGINRVDVTAIAAAWAGPAGELTPNETYCPLPLALPDPWTDFNGDGIPDPGEVYDPQGTGITDYDIGDLIALKVSGSEETGGPPICRTESGLVTRDLCRELPDSDNWRCWYREAENADGGSEVLGPRIYPGEGCDFGLEIGDTVWTASASGNKQSLVHTVSEDFGGTCTETTTCTDPLDPATCTTTTSCPNGSFGDLIRADPDLYWDDIDDCVKRAGSLECYEGQSPRIRQVPLVAPFGTEGTGAGVNTTIVDFTGVFIDKVACSYNADQLYGPGGNLNVYIRIVRAPTAGAGGGGNEEDPTGTTLKRLQLIE